MSTELYSVANQLLFKTIHGECLEEMRKLPDQSVDMVMCDLPYGTTQCKWDTIINLEELWQQYKRICKGAVVLTAAQPFTSLLGASNLSQLKYSWVWEKGRPTGFLNAKKMPLKGFEDVLVFARTLPLYNPQDTTAIDRKVKNTGTKSQGRGASKLNDDHSFHGTVTGADENDCYKQTVTGYPRGIVQFTQDPVALHPTQKPVALMEYLIKTYTNLGMTVLDNCMGSGTTGIACANTGRSFIGIEQDPTYYAIARERIQKAYLERKSKETASGSK